MVSGGVFGVMGFIGVTVLLHRRLFDVRIRVNSKPSDIVLLVGFDWTEKPVSQDRLAAHRAANYRRFVQDAIAATPDVQWVLIDHAGPIGSDLAHLGNLTQDSLESVIELLRPQ
jgi:hypothetical protein